MMHGWNAVVAAHEDERETWFDVGHDRALAVLSYRTLDLVERMRAPGDGTGDGEAVLRLAGAAWLFLDTRYEPVEVADMQEAVASTDREDVAGWREADDPRFTWQTDVLLRLGAVFMEDASNSGNESVTRESLTRVIAACVEYADWAGLAWPPSQQ